MSPEVWMRGAIEGIAPQLQPVVHSLMQVREEVEALDHTLTADELHRKPLGVASVAFHLRHIAGSLDRLLTYARRDSLSEMQLQQLRDESKDTDAGRDEMVEVARAALDRALGDVRRWSQRSGELFEAREVGRQRLPSTVFGLLVHAAEHAQRHSGQITTTVRIVLAARGRA